MLIETMPEVLTWGEGASDVMKRVHNAYVLLLSERLGERLAELTRFNSRGGLLTELVMSLPDKSFLSFLMAPETTFRLLWPERQQIETTLDFLLDSAYAELARVGQISIQCGVVWTATGDVRFDAGGNVHHQPQLKTMMPIDFESPYALGLDVEGNPDAIRRLRPALCGTEQQRVLERLAHARDGIKDADPGILEFVVTFTKALVAIQDADTPEGFSSGSSGQYVGRSYLANPHLHTVDEVILADALVHEAIHSLLYMQEQNKPWVYDLNLYGPTVRTKSPWSGNPLPLRPYMQAAFVWYGLLQFWTRAMTSRAFPSHRVSEQIVRAANGFLASPLLDQVAPYAKGVAPDVLAAIQQMQQQVVDTFGDAVGVCRQN
jgi:hypothetical protein